MIQPTPVRERALRLVPILLLITVALAQIHLARSQDLSPWSGGGFGMFSTTDAGGARHLHAFQLRPGLLREIVPPSEIASVTRRALTLPSAANLRALALEVATLPSPDHGPAHGVRIQVFSARFDPQTLAPANRLLRGIDVSLER